MPETTLPADVPAAVLGGARLSRGHQLLVFAPELQAMFGARAGVGRCASNPMSADMSRYASLIPSLVSTLQHNPDPPTGQWARFLSLACAFRLVGGQLEQQPVLAGLLSTPALVSPESWGGGAVDRADFTRYQR